MKGLNAGIFLLLITLAIAAEEYTQFPYTMEAEDCEDAGEPWTSIYDKKIKGEFSGKVFVYLT